MEKGMRGGEKGERGGEGGERGRKKLKVPMTQNDSRVWGYTLKLIFIF